MMRKAILSLSLLITSFTAFAETSYTEGVITSEFVDEAAMKADLLQMLANFSTYMKNDFHGRRLC